MIRGGVMIQQAVLVVFISTANKEGSLLYLIKISISLIVIFLSFNFGK